MRVFAAALTLQLAAAGFRGHEVERLSSRHTVVRHAAAAAPLAPPDYAAALLRVAASDSIAASDRSTGGVGSPVFPDKYFEFVPEHLGAVRTWAPYAPGPTLMLEPKLSKPCFKASSAAASALVKHGSDGTFGGNVTFEAREKSSLLCTDFYLVASLQTFHVLEVGEKGKTVLQIEGMSGEEAKQVAAAGWQVFCFSGGELATLESVYETVLLFTAQLGKKVGDAEALRNIQWLKDYMSGTPGALGKHFGERRSTTDVEIKEELIGDGDLFCIVRFDGLDPIINWGTGGNCGHNVMALRLEGVLHIVEAQSKSGYWPKDYVQRNTFKEWIKMAKQADYNVLWLPLSAASKSKFNAKQAASIFEAEYESLLYGFPNMLWGWLDTANGRNFPSGSSGNVSSPLSNELLASVFSVLDPLLNPPGPQTMPSLWNGALSHRLGLTPAAAANQTTAQLMALARAQKKSFGDLLAMPEQDKWEYRLADSSCGRKAGCTGPAQVCNVFVCKMWRAGGMFSADFNCGEQAPIDTYSMALFDEKPTLPAACKAADPMNDQFCQILGQWRLALPSYNSVKPFTNMREHCPTQSPDYASSFWAPSSANKNC